MSYCAEQAALEAVDDKHAEFEPWIMYKYGMSYDQYMTLGNAQTWHCAICGDLPQTTRLSIDHDHKSGKNRGLLCSSCNSLLGFAKDSPARLMRALAYLRKHAVRTPLTDQALVGDAQ